VAQAVAVLELGEAEGKVGLVGEGEAATVEVVAAAMMVGVLEEGRGVDVVQATAV